MRIDARESGEGGSSSRHAPHFAGCPGPAATPRHLPRPPPPLGRPTIQRELELAAARPDEVLRSASVQQGRDEVKGILMANLNWLDEVGGGGGG